MNPLKDRNVMMQVRFTHPPKRAQKIAQPCPDALYSIIVDLAHPIAILIPCPFPLARRVTDLLKATPILRQMVIGGPLVGVHRAAFAGMNFDKGLQRLAVTMVTHVQAHLTAFASHDPGHRRSVVVPRAVPPDFIRATARRILRLVVFLALFARVLIQLISLYYHIAQFRLRSQPLNLLLDLMPYRAQMGFVHLQFLGQMRGRHSLPNAAHDQDDLSTRIPRPAPYRAGEQIKHCAALPTAIVHDRSTVAIMGLLLRCQRMPLRTAQPVWMQHVEQIIIAALFVQQFVYRKQYHGCSVDRRSPRVNPFTSKAR